MGSLFRCESKWNGNLKTLRLPLGCISEEIGDFVFGRMQCLSEAPDFPNASRRFVAVHARKLCLQSQELVHDALAFGKSLFKLFLEQISISER